jgi:hypothetical protein
MRGDVGIVSTRVILFGREVDAVAIFVVIVITDVVRSSSSTRTRSLTSTPIGG